MSYGPICVFSITMTSGATLTGQLDLARSWNKVYIDPTGATAEVRFQASPESGGTFRQVLLPQGMASTATVQSNIWKIASAASGSIIDAPAGLRYLKIETTAAVANGNTFKLICSN